MLKRRKRGTTHFIVPTYGTFYTLKIVSIDHYERAIILWSCVQYTVMRTMMVDILYKLVHLDIKLIGKNTYNN